MPFKSHAASVALAALVLLASPSSSFAQTEGRVGVGIAVTRLLPADDALDTTNGVGIQVRLAPKDGFGFTGGFNWFGADVNGSSIGFDEHLGRVTIRGLLGGVGYTVSRGRAALTLTAMAGPTLNTLRLADGVKDRVVVGDDDEEQKFTLSGRIGAGVTYTVAPRIALTGFGGYMINRPKFTFQVDGTEIPTRWKTDGVILSVGAIVSLF